MKAKMLFLALCMTVSTLYAASGDPVPYLTVIRQDSSSVYVINYSGSKVGTVTFTIKDDKQNVMVTKTIKNLKDFTMPINFSSVPEGVYDVQIDNGVDKRSQSVNYSYDITPTYTHVIGLGDHRYMVQAFHAGMEEITITIYNGPGAIVFDQKEIINGQFDLVFNLTNVLGEPSFEITENSGRSMIVPALPRVVLIKK